MFIFLAILWGRKTASMLMQDMQGICTTNVRASINLTYFAGKTAAWYHALWPLALLHGFSKNATSCTTVHEVCMTVTQQHLRQSCNSASTSDISPAPERTTIMWALYGCLTFSENKLEVCYFFCRMAWRMWNHTIDMERTGLRESRLQRKSDCQVSGGPQSRILSYWDD